MGLFSKRSKARSSGSSITSTTEDSISESYGGSKKFASSSDVEDSQAGGDGPGLKAGEHDQDGSTSNEGGAGKWVENASSAAERAVELFPNAADPYVGCASVSVGGQESNLIMEGISATTAAAGGMTVRQAAQEVAFAGLSAALVAGGVSSIIAPVLAVTLLVGHVLVRGATRYVLRQVSVHPDQKSHLENLHLNQVELPKHFTMVINGTLGIGQFSASLSPTDDTNYDLVDPKHLRGLSRLIGDGKGCTVRDLGDFTQEAPRPFTIRLTMPDVLALIRQSWRYEKFLQTKCKTMTVMLIHSQKRKGTKLWVAWQNSGPLDATQAMILTEKEWKATKFSGKTKPLPDAFADVDVALDRGLVFMQE